MTTREAIKQADALRPNARQLRLNQRFIIIQALEKYKKYLKYSPLLCSILQEYRPFSHSTVTDLAKLRGLSMSQPLCSAT